MKRWMLLAAVYAAGCVTVTPPRPVVPPNVSQYHHPAFLWRGVARLVILPMVNETTYPEAAEEVRRSLHAELQQVGLFESVPAPPDLTELAARLVRDTGRFSEADIVKLARCGGADVILVGTLSHYSPYRRPRVGLTLQAISPDMGQVVASVDGLWDSNDYEVADRAVAWYTRQQTRREARRDETFGRWDDAYALDLVLQSPHLFQRFVCGEAVRLLVGEPVLKPVPVREPRPRGDQRGRKSRADGCGRKGLCPPQATQGSPSNAGPVMDKQEPKLGLTPVPTMVPPQVQELRLSPIPPKARQDGLPLPLAGPVSNPG